MKLTYIANIRFPTERAHGIQIMSMCEALGEQGIDVTLLVSDRKTHITEEPFYYYGVKKAFKVQRLKTFDLTHYGHIFRALAYHIERITFTRSAIQYAKKHRDEIFYTRDELTFIRFTEYGIPVVYEMHTMPTRLHLYREAFSKAKKIVAITKHLKQALEDAGVSSQKILVAPDGVNVDKFENHGTKKEAREYLHLDEKTFVAMYIGLFDEWKGYKTLLEASRKLQPLGTHTVLIGGTDKQIRELKKEFNSAEFREFVPYTELPLLQQAADVLVIPNSATYDIGRLYTSPLKLFAHMTSGIPMVVSDLPSLREIVDENSALLFKPDDPDALALAIQSVRDNPYKMKLIAEHAKQAVQAFSWKNRAKTIINSIQ